jgi:hypothetical protein
VTGLFVDACRELVAGITFRNGNVLLCFAPR